MTVLEDGAGGDRHLVSAPAATPAVSPNRPSLSPCAPRAHPSGGPAQGYKILGTGLVAVEALLQLQQSPGIILAHDHEHYMLGLVASSKYPYYTIKNYPYDVLVYSLLTRWGSSESALQKTQLNVRREILRKPRNPSMPLAMPEIAYLHHGLLVLLCYKNWRRQQGHLGRERARWVAIWRRRVAMECGLCRSVLIGSATRFGTVWQAG